MKPIDGKLYLKGNPVSDTHGPDPNDGVTLFADINDNFKAVEGSLADVDTSVAATQADVAVIKADLSDRIDVQAADWSALSAITGTREGQPAVALGGSGTHTDPVNGATVDSAGRYAWSVSPAGWEWLTPLDDTFDATKSATLDRVAYSPASLTALSQRSLAVKFFPEGSGGLVKFMEISVPSGGRSVAQILLKRHSISSLSADVGLSQPTWEPDVVKSYDHVFSVRKQSSSVFGAWSSDNGILPGTSPLRATSQGSKRAFTVKGTTLRLGWLSVAGAADMQVEIDGIKDTVLSGDGSATIEVLNRALPVGDTTVTVEHVGPDGDACYVFGVDMCDGEGYVEGQQTTEVGEIGDGSVRYAGPGVQTLVVTKAGGLRMGGGHGGAWLLAPTQVYLDGKPVDPDGTDKNTEQAGRDLVFLEDFVLRHATDPNDKANTLEDFAFISRRMRFRPGGYDCAMDIAIVDDAAIAPAVGQMIKDFLFSMLQLTGNMEEQERPTSKAIPADVPFVERTLNSVVVDNVNGLKVTTRCVSNISSEDGAVTLQMRDIDGDPKYYRAAAFGDNKRFTNRSYVEYSHDFENTSA